MQSTGDPAPEDPMEVDLPGTSGSSSREHPSPLTRVWAARASRREREDKDLVPEPDSPELSEDEDEVEGDGSLDADEPNFLTDDEEPAPVHVEIPARERLTADFQLRATKAGALLIVTNYASCSF